MSKTQHIPRRGRCKCGRPIINTGSGWYHDFIQGDRPPIGHYPEPAGMA